MKCWSTFIGYDRWSWVYNSILAMLLSGVFLLVLAKTIKVLKTRFSKKRYISWYIFFNSLDMPLYFFISSSCLLYVLHTVTNALESQNYHIFLGLSTQILIASSAWVMLRFLDQAERYMIFDEKYNGFLDTTYISAVSKLSKIIVVSIAILISMDSYGVSVQGLLAFGGASGIVMGFASKDILSNMMGTLTVYWDQPFKIGDCIKIDEKNIEGYVESIGIRSTKIMTLKKRPVYVPNIIFSQGNIENVSRMSHRMIDETLLIEHSYYTAMHKLVQAIDKMLKTHPDLDAQNAPCIAKFYGSNIYGLKIRIYCFSTVTDFIQFQAVYEDVMFKVHNLIKEHEVVLSVSYIKHSE